MILTRADWGARPLDRRAQVVTAPAHTLVIHHQGSDSPGPFITQLRRVEAFHMDTRGWSGPGYNAAVSIRGECAELRGWWANSIAAAGHLNNGTFSVLALGDYHTRSHPTVELLDGLAEVCAHAVRIGRVFPTLRIIGHRDQSPTSCPGDRLHPLLGEVRRRAGALLNALPTPNQIDEEDQMWIARTNDPEGRQRNALVSGVFRTEFVSNAAMNEAVRLGAKVVPVSWEFFSRQLVNARGS